jgi:hypothetical protein
MAPPSRDGGTVCRKPIQTAWEVFLAPYDWQWFATFTFKDAIHPEAAAKRFRHWVLKLDESNGYRPRSKLTHKRRCAWVRGLEYQKRQVVHFHVLLGNLPWALACSAQAALWADYWLQMGNTGFARIEVCGTSAAAVRYVTKYASKGGEIDVSPNLLRIGEQLAGF